jgi:diguanylate cyclase (GGDEF)-like protein
VDIEPPKAAPPPKPKKSRKAKKGEPAVAAAEPAVESAAQAAKPETAPAPVAAEEPEKPAAPERPSEEPVPAADPVASPVDEVKPDPEPMAAEAPPPELSPEPPSAPEPTLSTETETTPAPESATPEPAPAPEPENVAESLVTVREAPSREETDEEPSPSTLLDAPPPAEGDEVTWIVAESRTQDMTLEEAAARAASSGEPETPPAAFEDLAATRAGIEEERQEAAAPPLRRPLFRVGEVPIYDEPDFLTEFKRELSKCRRVDRPLTLILIRVGDLGQIIELFGKDFRERVLWHIADQAMQSLREVDLVGMMSSKSLIALTAFASDRYGGGRIVARLRQAMHRKPFRVGEELPPIIPALDFGMASFPADGNDVSGLMTRAEEDLPRVEEKPAALD